MTMQAVEMTEAPARIAERVSRLEGSSEQVSERLRDLTTQMEALRAELRLELSAGLTAQAAATESLRSDMDRKFEAQAAQIEALRLELTSFPRKRESAANGAARGCACAPQSVKVAALAYPRGACACRRRALRNDNDDRDPLRPGGAP